MKKGTVYGMFFDDPLNAAIILLRNQIVVLYDLTDETGARCQETIADLCVGSIFWGPAFDSAKRTAGGWRCEIVHAGGCHFHVGCTRSGLLRTERHTSARCYRDLVCTDHRLVYSVSFYSLRLLSDRWKRRGHVLQELVASSDSLFFWVWYFCQNSLFTRKQIVSLIIPLIIDQLLNTGIGFWYWYVNGFKCRRSSCFGDCFAGWQHKPDLFLYFSGSFYGRCHWVSAQYIGRKDQENAKNSGTSLHADTIVSVLVAVFCYHRQKAFFDFYLRLPRCWRNAEGSPVFHADASACKPCNRRTNTCAAFIPCQRKFKISHAGFMIMNAVHVIWMQFSYTIWRWELQAPPRT